MRKKYKIIVPNSEIICITSGVALGDLQCSVLSTLESPRDAVLNISTSAQLAFVVEDYVPKIGATEAFPIEYFPYFESKYLAVAASLNGGNTLAAFIKMVQEWSLEMGSMINQCNHFKKEVEFVTILDVVIFQLRYGKPF